MKTVTAARRLIMLVILAMCASCFGNGGTGGRESESDALYSNEEVKAFADFRMGKALNREREWNRVRGILQSWQDRNMCEDQLVHLMGEPDDKRVADDEVEYQYSYRKRDAVTYFGSVTLYKGKGLSVHIGRWTGGSEP